MKRTIVILLTLAVAVVSQALAGNEGFKIGVIDCTSGSQQTFTYPFGYNAGKGKHAPTESGWSLWLYDATDGVSQPTGTLTLYVKPLSPRQTTPYGSGEEIAIFTSIDLSNIDTANRIDFGKEVGNMMKCFGIEIYATMTVTGNNEVTLEIVRDTN